MDEFIREVDEEYRRDRIAAIWQRFSGLIIAVAILVVAGVGGWRYWQHTQQQQAEIAASRFDEAVRLSRDGKADESERTLKALLADAPAGYRMLSRLRLAAETGKQNPEEGARAYDALAGDPTLDGAMQDLARLRASMLRVDLSDPGSASRDLERLAAPTNPWRHTAREMLGLVALKRADFDAAGRWFDQIAQDRDTPAGLKGRLEIYTALAAGGPVQTSTP